MEDLKMTKYDHKICIDEANAFYETAKLLDDSDAVEFALYKKYPYFVNTSFACELYLKALLIKNSDNSKIKRSHDLESLFHDLEPEQKQEIEKKYSEKCHIPLDELFKADKDSFEEWRYAFEKPVDGEVTALLIFAEVLKNFCSDEK